MKLNFIKALFTTWVGWIILYLLGLAFLLIINSIDFKSRDFTREYKGKVDNRTPITFNLVSKSGVITGYYMYDKFRNMVKVEGTINKKKITIDGFYKGKQIDKFEGTISGNSIYGTWYGLETGKSKKFEVITGSTIAENHVLENALSMWKFLGLYGLMVLLIFLNFGIGPFERSKKIVMPMVVSTPSTAPKSIPVSTPPSSLPSTTDAASVGQKFEGYVAGLLPKEYYQFLEWRSDKTHNGLHPISNTFPDLHFRRINTKAANNEFTIECKYRSAVINEVFEFDPRQLKNYISFRKEKGIPVFLALGIGGIPEKPDKVYVFPITETTTTHIMIKDLGKSKHEKDYLYYNPEKLTLG